MGAHVWDSWVMRKAILVMRTLGFGGTNPQRPPAQALPPPAPGSRWPPWRRSCQARL